MDGNNEFVINFGQLLEALGGNNVLGSSRPQGNPPASQLSINELDDVVIEEKHIEQGLVCSVCGEDFCLNQDGKRMPCKHIFHDMCLLPWLKQHNTCPTCRYELPTLDPDYEASKRVNSNTNELFEELIPSPHRPGSDYDFMFS